MPKNTKKLGFNENSNDRINIKEKLMDSLRSKFKPEFLNRIDVIVIFESLKQNDIIQIAEIMLNNLNKKLKDHSIELRFTDEAKNQLAQEGYSETYGARPLKRLIEQKIEDQLAESLLSGQVKEKSKVDVDYKNGEFTFKSID